MVQEQESEKLLFTPPPKNNHRYQGDQQKLQDIYAFLANTKWKTCTEEQPHGATWFELFVVWEQSGYNKEQTRQGQEEQLAEDLKKGYKATKRWKEHLEKRARD